MYFFYVQYFSDATPYCYCYCYLYSVQGIRALTIVSIILNQGQLVNCDS